MSLSTFTGWLRRHGKDRGLKVQQRAAPEWIELPQAALPATGTTRLRSAYRVCFPSGHMIELAQGFSAQEVSWLCHILCEL